MKVLILLGRCVSVRLLLYFAVLLSNWKKCCVIISFLLFLHF